MSTRLPFSHLRLSAVDTDTTVRIELDGDLDYDSGDQLLVAATDQLARHPGLRDLHLHCAGLGTTDSTGLSVLLMIRRRADEAGVRLHLDDRPLALDRMLEVTGTFHHLMQPPADTAPGAVGTGEAPAADDAEADAVHKP